MLKFFPSKQVMGSKTEQWWMRGREESFTASLDAVLVDRIEWLPDNVVTQLIAPAKNDDVISSYMDLELS